MSGDKPDERLRAPMPWTAAETGGFTAYLRQTDDEAALVILNFGTSSVENLTLTAYASHLAAGSYRMTPLLSDEPAADLGVERGGTFTSYTPLPTLEPRTGYVFALEPAR